MAKWKFGLASEGSSLKTKVDYSNDGYIDYVVRQENIEDIKKEVERDKYMLEHASKKQKASGWRKAFTIPDIVALEILQKHGLDIHKGDIMKDHMAMKKLKYIIQTEYPHLLIST